jgi:hypothetical protein
MLIMYPIHPPHSSGKPMTPEGKNKLKKYICIYMYIYIYINVHTYMYPYIFTYLCIYIYIYSYLCIYIYAYLYIYVYIYIQWEAPYLRGKEQAQESDHRCSLGHSGPVHTGTISRYYLCILEVIISIIVNFFGIYILCMYIGY